MAKQARKRVKQAPKPKKIEDGVRQSSGQKVYMILRERILSLELSPSAELDEVQLSQHFGVSRTPVREALIRLAADGLVVLAQNRGARVAPIDLDQVPQILEALELFQRITTRWAALRHRPEHLIALESANQEFADACATEDPRAIVEANWKFHDAINQACGNRYFADDCSKMLRSVMRLSLLAFLQEDAKLASYDELAGQHDDMIEAIREKNVDLSEQLIYQHSDEFRQRIQTYVSGVSTKDISLAPR
ncbi:GntR family transcriptional regulator [Hyphococcus lacteus]|uniref:GntR family transcriptional regulator n=1 Tax=Hyphococcus lacteus TaxID=3143536 RepID=A0ABV3Z3H9_9PROT